MNMTRWMIIAVVVGTVVGCVTRTEPPRLEWTAPRIGAIPVEDHQGEVAILLKGAVPKEGVCWLPKRSCTVVFLLLKIEGLQMGSDGRNAIIRRRNPDGKQEEIKVDLVELLKNGVPGDPDKDVPLQQGDEVTVPRKLYSF